MDLDPIVHELLRTRAPVTPSEFRQAPGIYAIFVTGLGHVGGVPTPPTGLVFIGTTRNLTERVIETHLSDDGSGFSTVRRTIGALLKHDLDLHARPRGSGTSPSNTTHYRFDPIGEHRLTWWMQRHLEIGLVEVADPNAYARDLIAELRPILNLKGWPNPHKKMIIAERAACQAEATRSRRTGPTDVASGGPCGQARSLRSEANRSARRGRANEGHVAPLQAVAAEIRKTVADPADVPAFDPCDGGTAAKILLLLEAPGPGAVASGFVSMNNPDGTASNLLDIVRLARVERPDVLMWNVVPWYLGASDHTKIRPASCRDIVAASPHLKRVIEHVPGLRCCVLFGAKAQAAEPLIRALTDVDVFVAPHPSPRVFRPQPHLREAAVDALRQARGMATA